MPKRTNQFQRLITLIEVALAPSGARVVASEELVGETGKGREVDIVVYHNVGEHKIILSVECTALGRPADVGWVEKMRGKHSGLLTNKLILVSKSGFTPEARDVAKLSGIDTYSLPEAETLNWSSVVRSIPLLKVDFFIMPVLTGGSVVLGGSPDSELTAEMIEDAEVIDPGGRPPRTPKDLMIELLENPGVIDALRKHARSDMNTIVSFTAPLKPGFVLAVRSGQQYPLLAVEVQAQCRKELREIRLEQTSYGSAAVAHGQCEILGRPMEVVFTQQEGQPAFAAVQVSPPATAPQPATEPAITPTAPQPGQDESDPEEH
jgi:hypothetical protein